MSISFSPRRLNVTGISQSSHTSGCRPNNGIEKLLEISRLNSKLADFIIDYLNGLKEEAIVQNAIHEIHTKIVEFKKSFPGENQTLNSLERSVHDWKNIFDTQKDITRRLQSIRASAPRPSQSRTSDSNLYQSSPYQSSPYRTTSQRPSEPRTSDSNLDQRIPCGTKPKSNCSRPHSSLDSLSHRQSEEANHKKQELLTNLSNHFQEWENYLNSNPVQNLHKNIQGIKQSIDFYEQQIQALKAKTAGMPFDLSIEDGLLDQLKTIEKTLNLKLQEQEALHSDIAKKYEKWQSIHRSQNASIQDLGGWISHIEQDIHQFQQNIESQGFVGSHTTQLLEKIKQVKVSFETTLSRKHREAANEKKRLLCKQLTDQIDSWQRYAQPWQRCIPAQTLQAGIESIKQCIAFYEQEIQALKAKTAGLHLNFSTEDSLLQRFNFSTEDSLLHRLKKIEQELNLKLAKQDQLEKILAASTKYIQNWSITLGSIDRLNFDECIENIKKGISYYQGELRRFETQFTCTYEASDKIQKESIDPLHAIHKTLCLEKEKQSQKKLNEEINNCCEKWERIQKDTKDRSILALAKLIEELNQDMTTFRPKIWSQPSLNKNLTRLNSIKLSLNQKYSQKITDKKKNFLRSLEKYELAWRPILRNIGSSDIPQIEDYIQNIHTGIAYFKSTLEECKTQCRPLYHYFFQEENLLRTLTEIHQTLIAEKNRKENSRRHSQENSRSDYSNSTPPPLPQKSLKPFLVELSGEKALDNKRKIAQLLVAEFNAGGIERVVRYMNQERLKKSELLRIIQMMHPDQRHNHPIYKDEFDKTLFGIQDGNTVLTEITKALNKVLAGSQ